MTLTTLDGSGRMRAAVALAGCALMALPLAHADAGSAGVLRVSDPSGDANGVNDQGEGFLGDVRAPGSHPQADLTELAFGPLEDAEQRVVGFTVSFTVAARFAPVTSARNSETFYTVIMQPTPDCRLAVVYTVRSWTRGVGELQVGNGCSTPFLRAVLTTSRTDRSVRIEVPYGVGPSQLRAGEQVDDYYAATSMGLSGSPGLVDLDTIYTRPRYTLPG